MRLRVKMLSTEGGLGGTILILSWKCNFSIYLDIQVYYLDPSNNPTFMPSIGSLCVDCIYSLIFLPYHTLLRSEIFWHSKAYSSHSFQRTGIGLSSLSRVYRCVSPISSVYLEFFIIFKVV